MLKGDIVFQSVCRAGNNRVTILCIIMLIVLLMGCRNINKNNKPQSYDQVELHRVNLRDSVLVATIYKNITAQNRFSISDTCIVDFYQSCFDSQTYYLEIRSFTPDIVLEESIGYYAVIQDKWFVFPNSIPKEIFEEMDELLIIKMDRVNEWDTSFPFLHMRYKIGEICTEFMEYSVDGYSYWPV